MASDRTYGMVTSSDSLSLIPPISASSQMLFIGSKAAAQRREAAVPESHSCEAGPITLLVFLHLGP